MKNLHVKLSVKWDMLKDALKNEEGQDLVEYAMIMGCIALAATAGMSSLAAGINTVFGNVGAVLTAYTG